MQHRRSLRRSVLLALSLLSACAASDATPGQVGGDPEKGGVSASFLAGRFAATQTDLDFAATEFLKALETDPDNPDLQQQAFLACLLTGRSEAVALARHLVDNPAAELVVADADVMNGKWEKAETRFSALPRQGLTQVLQPLLVAWAQQGQGFTDAALATLQPFVDGQRFRAVYALHAGMIADLAGRQADAAKFYQTAETDFGGLNLQLARVIASWQVRQGHAAAAERTISGFTEANQELAMSREGLLASIGHRPVATPSDGIAEAYFALAAALQAQNATDFALVLIRLAIDLKPDFTSARLLAGEIMGAGKHPGTALRLLDPVSDHDPLIGLVRLRRAVLTEELGHAEDAIHSLDQLAQDYPDRPEPLVAEGEALRSQHRYADAVQAYDRAVSRVPNPTRADWPMYYDRGIALERSNQWAKAEADFEKALQLSPDQPFTLNYLGYSWAEQGRNLPRARKMIERALEQRPNDGSIMDSLGWVTFRQGDVPGAVRSLERAVELDPEDSTVNGHLGDAYWAAGRKLEAQFQWHRALNLNPDPDDAEKLKTKLHEADASQPAPPATAQKVP